MCVRGVCGYSINVCIMGDIRDSSDLVEWACACEESSHSMEYQCQDSIKTK